MDTALRARRRQGPGAAKRQVAPHLPAAQRDVRIRRMRLRHGVLSGQGHHQVAISADGLARKAVKLQVVGIGPGPAGAGHARLVVRRARDDEALRARGIRRPAQQNAYAGHGNNRNVMTAGVGLGSKHTRSDLRRANRMCTRKCPGSSSY